MSVSEVTSESRLDLMAWVNAGFGTKVTRLDQLSTGAIYCHILQSLYPDLPLFKRANFAAKTDYEISQNYRIIHQTFEKLGSMKRLDPVRLAKGYTQDHLELLHCIKRLAEEVRGVSCEETGGKLGNSLSLASTNASSRASTPTLVGKLPAGIDPNPLRATNARLTAERDHYFEKLMRIEAILQKEVHAEEPFRESLLEIVYSPDGGEES